MLLYPLGFPVALTADCPDVVRAAEESWGSCEPRFAGPPLALRVRVSERGGKAGEPSFHFDRHLLSIVADRENYAVADLDRLEAACYVTSRTVADRPWFRWFFLDALILSLLAQRHTVPVHAGCVARHGAGVLLFGASGAGKSTLAWACARAGWSLVSDDAAWLLPGAAVAIGRPQQVRLRPDAPRHFPELARLATKARPNGKLSIEINPADFPGIRTASQAPVTRIVFLDRSGTAPGMVSVPKEAAVEAMLRDCVPYRDQVHAHHVATVRKLSDLPAHRLQYQTLDEAVGLLSSC